MANSAQSTAPLSERTVLTFLIGQGFFIGASLTLLYMTANTLFLLNYGSETLPYLYIVSGVVIAATSFGFAALQKRRSLATLALGVYGVFGVAFFIARVTYSESTARVLSFAMMLAFSLMTLLCSIVLGAQAGRVFDVRQMKRLYPLVLASQILAVVMGGLLVTPLTRWLGGVENLLALSGGAMFIALAFLVATIRRFGSALTQVQATGVAKPAKSLPQLLKKRYVRLILAYQVLSAIGTQLVIFVLLSVVDATFTTAEALTGFFGNLLAIGTFCTLLFLLFIAGRLLNRFGLIIGLTINPGAVTAAIAGAALVGLFVGQSSPLFFWLIVAARFFDFVLTTGMTDTALKATYQALPADERVTVQTGVEGIGNPIAVGLTGVLLLIFNSLSGLTLVHNVLFTLGVCVIWSGAAVLAYRNYAAALQTSLSRRVLNAAELTLENSSSLIVIERLLKSADVSQVRLALDVLEQTEHASLNAKLVQLLDHPTSEVRLEALLRLEQRATVNALPQVTAQLAREADVRVKGQAVRTLCALAEADAVDDVAPYIDDAASEVRLGAMVGLLRYGGIAGVLIAAERLSELERSPDPVQRAFVAHVIGQVASRSFYKPLLKLLTDSNEDDRRAALLAAGQVGHPRLLPLVVDNLNSAALRSAAMSALMAGGHKILPLVEQALIGELPFPEKTVVRLVRICGQLQGDRVVTILKQHLNHPDDDVQYEVLSALQRCGYRAADDEQPAIERILRGEAEHGLRTLLARQALGGDQASGLLPAALLYEFNQARRRVLLLLSFIYEARALAKLRERLEQGASSEKALALETLDVMLDGAHKAIVLPLVDPTLSESKRIQGLRKHLPLADYAPQACLREIIVDTAIWTHGWTRACAIQLAAERADRSLIDAIEGALAITEPPIRETAAWALQRLSPETYQRYAADLRHDPDPQVARLALHLAA